MRGSSRDFGTKPDAIQTGQDCLCQRRLAPKQCSAKPGDVEAAGRFSLTVPTVVEESRVIVMAGECHTLMWHGTVPVGWVSRPDVLQSPIPSDVSQVQSQVGATFIMAQSEDRLDTVWTFHYVIRHEDDCCLQRLDKQRQTPASLWQTPVLQPVTHLPELVLLAAASYYTMVVLPKLQHQPPRRMRRLSMEFLKEGGNATEESPSADDRSHPPELVKLVASPVASKTPSEIGGDASSGGP